MDPVEPRERTYAVTAAGEGWADKATAGLRDTDRSMAQWLARYRAPARRGGPRSLPSVPAAS